MAKKCKKCGTPAHDDQSEFCYRCGSPVKEEPPVKVSLCSRCGNPAPDEESLFCNWCGTKYITELPTTPSLCPGCGYMIPDDLSQFCNRCGTPFNQPAKNLIPVSLPSHTPARPVSVRISKKRQAPAVEVPYNLWDPVPDQDVSPLFNSIAPPPSPTQKKYAHLPLIANELSGRNVSDEKIILGNTKKYAHLPLIADELKEKQPLHLKIESTFFSRPHQETKPCRPKKGFFDLLKR
jgi:hypothetical protein